MLILDMKEKIKSIWSKMGKMSKRKRRVKK